MNFKCFFFANIAFVAFLAQHAMAVMNISEENQFDILSIVAGVLHLGNVNFVENGNYAQVEDPEGTNSTFEVNIM